jgi:hypothetical protein
MTWTASVASASPAMMAFPIPNSLHTVARCRRSVSPSMMSSWMSEKLWISSMATAPTTPVSSVAPAAEAERRERAARTRFPPPARWWCTGSCRDGLSRPTAASSAGATIRAARVKDADAAALALGGRA